VWYGVSVTIFTYSFYTHSGLYDPQPFVVTKYDGTLPAGVSSTQNTFSVYVANASPPITQIQPVYQGSELGFVVGSVPGASENFYSRFYELNAWWQTYDLPVDDNALIARGAGVDSSLLPQSVGFSGSAAN
jgi:hypothetical protein